jgi:hypothetical protein
MPFLLLSLPVKPFNAVTACVKEFFDDGAALPFAEDCAGSAGSLRVVKGFCVDGSTLWLMKGGIAD